MDLIPFSLILSNASTLLSWLCVYLPHKFLLLLLALGFSGLALAVVGAVILACKGLVLLYARIASWLLTPRTLRFSPRSPPIGLPTRAGPRPPHAPAVPCLLRCPHCLLELVPDPRACGEGRPSLRTPLESPPSWPRRRASDVTPLTHPDSPVSGASPLLNPLSPPLRAQRPRHLKTTLGDPLAPLSPESSVSDPRREDTHTSPSVFSSLFCQGARVSTSRVRPRSTW